MFGQRFLLINLVVLIICGLLAACNLPSIITVGCNVTELINALNVANANVDLTTLELDPGCIYSLTSVDNTATSTSGGSIFEYGDNGLPQISTPITINGNNATIVRAIGASAFRIFFITDTGSLTINDLTLINGFADPSLPGGGGSAWPGSGGAIYNSGSYLEVNGSTLQANQAGAHGGAIFAISNATTYIHSSAIHDNNAPSGGGIFVYHGGLLSVIESEIYYNSASNSGGGINVEHGAELIVDASTFTSNMAGRHGGGIFKDAGSDRLPTTITGTTFQDNTAAWGGGGVFILRTPLTIADSHFIHNQANELGGGLGYENNATETASISNTTFDENIALWNGGGIHFSGELMTINNSTFQNNQAENGAGIHNGPPGNTRYVTHPGSEIILTGSTLQENIASGDGGGAFNEEIMTSGECSYIANESFTLGGGIHNTGEITSAGDTFDKNKTGFDGGGINNYNIAEVRGSTFTNNTSTRGGGFTSIGGDADISDSTFRFNSASDRGGAIFNFGATPLSSPMDIVDSEIKGNTAPYGGGIATSMGDTKISDSTISGNKASTEGGGIYNDGLMRVARCTLSENEASTLGGGIHNTEEITVLDSTFEGNTTGFDGGGFNTYSDATITGSTFVDNAATRGGGLASVGGDTLLINNTFSANSATDSGGGIFNMGPLIGVTTSGGAMHANHITVAYNTAPTGGGIATSGGLLEIKNSIVAYSPSGADCYTAGSDFAAVSENIDTDSSCAGFTLSADPLLGPLANNGGPTHTHALTGGSPAIDAAPDCTTVGGVPVPVDQRGMPRPAGPDCDLGSYEAEEGTEGPPDIPVVTTPAEPDDDPPSVTGRKNATCRIGPFSNSEEQDYLLAGQTALATGLSQDGYWVEIEGPTWGKPCWIWRELLDEEGDVDGTEVKIRPTPTDTPTPTPPPEEPEDDEKPQGCWWSSPSANTKECKVPCPNDQYSGSACTP
jgi:hypothetical protein